MQLAFSRIALSVRLLACLAVLAVLFAACSGRGDDEGADAPGNGDGEARSGLLIAFVSSADQPGAESKPIRLADLTGGKNRDIGDPGQYTEIAFSPDGQYLATADVDGVVRLLNVDDGEEAAEDAGDPVTGLSWSHNSGMLAIIRETSTTLLAPGKEATVIDGLGAPAGVNPLRWTWTPDDEVFALVTPVELILHPVLAGEAQVRVPADEFPASGDDWVLRVGESGREIGLVDLQPVSGLPEARAEYPITLAADGSITGGELRYVSIYDWGTLPSPQFDLATSTQFPAIRKTCDPCRSADGRASLLLFWRAGDGPTPAADVADWPEGTSTFLAIEAAAGQATAIDLGIAPSGAIDLDSWTPVYDVVRIGD